MKHSLDELLGIVHDYYPCSVPSYEPRYQETEEYHRLVAARVRAGATDDPWRAMLRRIDAQFPGTNAQNRSLHLPMGSADACYSACLWLQETHRLGFFVSFLVPYYVVYGARYVEQIEQSSTDQVFVFIDGVEVADPVPKPRRGRWVVSFDFSPDEQPYAAGIAREIEATFGCERMPPEVGNVVVPDVETSRRRYGAARIYDCLMSDEW